MNRAGAEWAEEEQGKEGKEEEKTTTGHWLPILHTFSQMMV